MNRAGRFCVSIVALALLGPVVLSRPAQGANPPPWANGPLTVSADGHFLVYTNGTPFLLMGDTVWDLEWLTRGQIVQYMQNRQQKGFNFVLVTVMNDFGPLSRPNAYGDAPFMNMDPTQPAVTPGNNPGNAAQYDFWDHIDYIVDKAAQYGLYVGILPAYGNYVGGPQNVFTVDSATTYATWIANRYKDRPNIIWINGGDKTPDADGAIAIWRALGNGLRAADPNHLITYHSSDKTDSSTWFQNDSWLDFDMFQSGGFIASPADENSYVFVQNDYTLSPAKPTLDGEPCYEDGAKDLQPGHWRDQDARRRAYWALFAGACGHVYGEGPVATLFGTPNDKTGWRGVPGEFPWQAGLNRPGASEMAYVKNLMLSRPFLTGVPDPSIISGDLGTGYDYLVATRGDGYLFVYDATGRPFTINGGKISGTQENGWWYNPRNGSSQSIGAFSNQGTLSFVPPGTPSGNGTNDWVLVLDDASRNYLTPGTVLGGTWSAFSENTIRSRAGAEPTVRGIFVLQNRGKPSLALATVSFYLSSTATHGAGDVQLGPGAVVKNLPGGRKRAVGLRAVLAPGTATSGKYVIGVVSVASTVQVVSSSQTGSQPARESNWVQQFSYGPLP